MNSNEGDDVYCGPYKATRLWNDVITAFRQDLPRGRHRRLMKTFENCFSGSSATDWLLRYIKTNPNFSSEATRENAVSLLNKLYRAGVFEEVKLSKSMRHKHDIQENRLYKFLPVSPSKVKLTRLPLAPRNDAGINRLDERKHILLSRHQNIPQADQKRKVETAEQLQEKPFKKILKRKSSIKKIDDEKVEDENYPPCHVITRVLTTKEIKNVWKSIFLLNLKKTLGTTSTTDAISPTLVDGYNIMHNCIYLNKSGIVTNIEGQDQLPHWVMSAMKCLARWPEPAEPGLPSYPGFEKDVFNVIKDYFLSLDEPLVPFKLYDVITNVFVMAGNSLPRHSSPHGHEEDPDHLHSLWTSASLENIILNLTKKYCMLDGTGENSNWGTREDLRNVGLKGEPQFGSQEDLRFAGCVNHEFNGIQNLPHFPSTDGMDKLASSYQDQNPFIQKSYPSLPVLSNASACYPLSRTSQSAGEYEQVKRRGLLSSKVLKKFGSTPNLKISRYETAFGPDNRTITRIFFRNGRTAETEQNDEGKEDGGCFLSLNNLEMCPEEAELQSQGAKRSDHAQSAECVFLEDKRPRQNYSSVHRKIGRSKSFAAADKGGSTQHSDIKINRFSTSDMNEYNLYNYCFTSEPKNREYRLNSSLDNSISVNGQRRSRIHSANLYGSTHSVASCKHNSSYNQACGIGSPGGMSCYGDEREPDQVIEKQLRGSPVGNISDKNTSFQEYNSFTLPNIKFRSQNKSSSQARNMQGEEYAPRSRKAHSSKTKSMYVDNMQAPSRLSFNLDDHDDRNTEHFSTRSGMETYLPYECYGPGYRPVLDASKERKSQGTSNMSSSERIVSGHVHKFTPQSDSHRRVTSTPLSPHTSWTGGKLNEQKPSALSLSRVTPFFSDGQQTGSLSRPGAFINFPQTGLSEERAKNALQLVTLLVPPANRRKLHFLFKLMMKMAANPNLCLDPTQTTRSLVLETFYQTIIRSEEESDLDELLVLQLVSFMLDFYADIFSPPSEIKSQVSERLKLMQRPQIVYAPKPATSVRFCQQTSLTDFENQGKINSHAAVEDLLERIIVDKDMTLKEKRRRLKQFQRTYPTIYTMRFPTPEDEALVLPTKLKVKQPLISKPLNKLKGLRL